MRVSLPLILIALVIGGCAENGDDVANEDIEQVAGVLNAYWTYGKPHAVQTAEEIAADREDIDDSLLSSGVDDAVIEPLSWAGATDDPDGARIDVLISVDTVKSDNGVLVRRNTTGSGTKCFRYTAKRTDLGVDMTYKRIRCPS